MAEEGAETALQQRTFLRKGLGRGKVGGNRKTIPRTEQERGSHQDQALERGRVKRLEASGEGYSRISKKMTRQRE